MGMTQDISTIVVNAFIKAACQNFLKFIEGQAILNLGFDNLVVSLS